MCNIIFWNVNTKLCKCNFTAFQKLVQMTKRRCLLWLRTPKLGNKVTVWLVHTFWVELCGGTINAHGRFLFHGHYENVIDKCGLFDSIITSFIKCSVYDVHILFADKDVVYSVVWLFYLWICFCISVILNQFHFMSNILFVPRGQFTRSHNVP